MLELQTATSPVLCIVVKVLQGNKINRVCVCVCARARARARTHVCEKERDIYLFSSVKCMNKLKWSCITLTIQVVIRLNLLCKSQYTHNDNIIVENICRKQFGFLSYTWFILNHPSTQLKFKGIHRKFKGILDCSYTVNPTKSTSKTFLKFIHFSASLLLPLQVAIFSCFVIAINSCFVYSQIISLLCLTFLFSLE